MNIFDRLARHQHVYETCGLEVPPFRITCKEHKIIFDTLVLSSEKEKSKIIRYYTGIELEVVMLVEEYC